MKETEYESKITIRVAQFSKGSALGGAATVCLIAKPESSLDRPPILSLEIGYHIRDQNIGVISPNQRRVLVQLANKPPMYVTVSLLSERPLGKYEWPHESEYSTKVGVMIARMAALSELSSLEDVVPNVL